jgi:C-terminal processing protease CtpA/Prc
MLRTLLVIAASLIIGFAAASLLTGPDEAAVRQTGSLASPAAESFDTEAPLEERIRALEQAVSDERYARQVLQEEVWFLSEELLQVTAAVGPETAPAPGSGEAADDSQSSRRDDYRRRNSIEGRVDRLVEAGFLPSQASMIVRREAELQMASLQARYEAERSGDPAEYWRNRDPGDDVLRQELGDADYERYLGANGQSTNVTVSSVIESSPAEAAGLMPGDEIVRYAGERVFSMSDLTQQTMNGEAGQNVVVDLLRDGQPMQIVLPRGPVGISGGRRSR